LFTTDHKYYALPRSFQNALAPNLPAVLAIATPQKTRILEHFAYENHSPQENNFQYFTMHRKFARKVYREIMKDLERWLHQGITLILHEESESWQAQISNNFGIVLNKASGLQGSL